MLQICTPPENPESQGGNPISFCSVADRCVGTDILKNIDGSLRAERIVVLCEPHERLQFARSPGQGRKMTIGIVSHLPRAWQLSSVAGILYIRVS